MEKYRKIYIDEIKLSISRLHLSQKRDKEILEGLKKININIDIYNKKSEELKNKIEEREQQIKSLEKRIENFNNGSLDHEISAELQENKNKQKQIMDSVEKKRTALKKENKEKKAFLDKGRDKDKLDRFLEKDYNYYYKQFLKSNHTIPDYMKQNLKNMPENKGYIWRGCWFFGEKPARRGEPLVMFEKNYGVLQIHEIGDTYHDIYEKKGESRKLISSVYRIKKK